MQHISNTTPWDLPHMRPCTTPVTKTTTLSTPLWLALLGSSFMDGQPTQCQHPFGAHRRKRTPRSKKKGRYTPRTPDVQGRAPIFMEWPSSIRGVVIAHIAQSETSCPCPHRLPPPSTTWPCRFAICLETVMRHVQLIHICCRAVQCVPCPTRIVHTHTLVNWWTYVHCPMQ